MGASLSSGGSASRKGRNRSRGAIGDINVTPFVDVMLVLLVIFMVTAPMLTAGITVDLPETSAATLPGSDEPLSVSVESDGDIYYKGVRVGKCKDVPLSWTAGVYFFFCCLGGYFYVGFWLGFVFEHILLMLEDVIKIM